ncbi:universal stress protein [Glaciihabitans sp. INWT7]|uniref:universal stress protein n=1 Tax=Glaciihabitans sp. INWT7 TaxID=2596912 RepID=UPI00162348B1|nr:universal stress protein [Glaciihabitans sp. INWT7]QNE46719.1 universal stress protein [Glaciihabitans sp. INWT7]
MNGLILVGADGTSAGRAAISWAVRRAASVGSRVMLVHVVDDEWGMIGEQSISELHPSAFELVEKDAVFARSINSSVTVTTRVLLGDPMVELGVASREVDLVVIGTHKTGFLHGRAFGSRSLQLAATAWCPVAVIPEGSSIERHGIVAGLDDSDAGRAAVRFAAIEAHRAHEELVLLRAWSAGSGTSGTDADRTDTRVRDAVETLCSESVALARSAGDDLLVRTRTLRRPPAEALVDAGISAELLVIGSSRRHGSQMSALGPVSHDVLLNIAGPTLVVHGDTVADATVTALDQPIRRNQ